MDRRQLVRHCLVVTGPTIALSGVVVAGLANVPADRKDLIPRWDTPDRWLVWVAVGLAAAWLAWASPLAPPRRRIAADVVMAGACAVALTVVVVDVRGRAVDLSVPLTASGLALSLAGALVTLAGRRRWPGDNAGDHDAGSYDARDGEAARLSGRVRWLARGGAVTAAALLAAGLAIGVVPVWAAAANTVTDPTHDGARHRRSTMDGPVAWQVSHVPDPLDGHFVGTAGGVAVLDENGGLRMLDPASGHQRWSFRRRDASQRLLDFKVAVSGDGRWLAEVYRVDAPRERWIDTVRHRDRAWVFDTVSGRMQSDVPVPHDASPLAVTADRLVTATRDVAGNPEVGGWLTAVNRDGDVTWRYRLDSCSPRQVLTVHDDLLALFGCDQGQSLVRLDSRTGRMRWTWRTGQLGDDTAGLGHTQYRHEAAVVVAGDTAVVDARVIGQTRQDGFGARVTAIDVRHNLVGVRLADGGQAWQRSDLHLGKLPTTPLRVGLTGLHAAAGTVVVTEQNWVTPGVERENTIAMRAFAADSGEPTWSVDLPGSQFTNGYRNDSVALLTDGRLVVTYRDVIAPSDEDRCVVAAWDAASGARRADVRITRTARGSIGTWCAASFPVEVGNGVALVNERGLLMLS